MIPKTLLRVNLQPPPSAHFPLPYLVNPPEKAFWYLEKRAYPFVNAGLMHCFLAAYVGIWGPSHVYKHQKSASTCTSTKVHG